MEEGLLDAQLFKEHIEDNHFADIIHLFTTRMASKGCTSYQNKKLVVCTEEFSVIARHLYKMGVDEIL